MLLDEQISAVSDNFADYKDGIVSVLNEIYENLTTAKSDDEVSDVCSEIRILINDIEHGRI